MFFFKKKYIKIIYIYIYIYIYTFFFGDLGMENTFFSLSRDLQPYTMLIYLSHEHN